MGGRLGRLPPPFSAKKIKGVPAYKLARQHKDVPLKAVQVEIKEFEILGLDRDRASFRARVASGTYMRSVAHDIGQQIGCGAHLASLRRTAFGEVSLSEAHTPDGLYSASQAEATEEMLAMLIHPRQPLPQFPFVTPTAEA